MRTTAMLTGKALAMLVLGLSGNSSTRSVGAACHFFVCYTYSSRYKLFHMLCIRGITADMQLSSVPLLYHRTHTMYDI